MLQHQSSKAGRGGAGRGGAGRGRAGQGRAGQGWAGCMNRSHLTSIQCIVHLGLENVTNYSAARFSVFSQGRFLHQMRSAKSSPGLQLQMLHGEKLHNEMHSRCSSCVHNQTDCTPQPALAKHCSSGLEGRAARCVVHAHTGPDQHCKACTNCTCLAVVKLVCACTRRGTLLQKSCLTRVRLPGVQATNAEQADHHCRLEHF